VATVLSDEELALLALAAEPDPDLGEDAVPIRPLDQPADHPLLPSWYMPAPATGSSHPAWQRRVAVGIVSSILLINAAGLCVTYGPVTFG
jgi:hypothetical protein